MRKEELIIMRKLLIAVMVMCSSSAWAGGFQFNYSQWSWAPVHTPLTAAANNPTFTMPLTSDLSISPGTGPATFTRASTQWLVNDAGVLTSFASGTPAINSKGILIEPASTNMVTYSEDPTLWSLTSLHGVQPLGSGSLANAIGSPSGSGNGTFIAENTNSTIHYFLANPFTTINATTYTGEIFLKAGTRTKARVQIGSNNSANGYWIDVDLTTGTLSNPGQASIGYSYISSSITPYILNWYRISVTGICPATSNALYVKLHDNSGSDIYVGDGISGLYVWGHQVEQSSFPTSYIPTTTGTVTRAATSLSIPGSNVPTNNASGIFDWTPPITMGTVRWLVGSYTDANNQWGIVRDGTAGTVILRKIIGGVTYDAAITQAITAGTTYHIGWRMSSTTGTDIFVNGVKGTVNANTTNAVIASTVKIGDDGNGGNIGTPQIKNFKVYPKAQTDAWFIAN